MINVCYNLLANECKCRLGNGIDKFNFREIIRDRLIVQKNILATIHTIGLINIVYDESGI